ncbi:hypothetical protein OG394_17135 [Kribbella sp. NBC_01245]|uniref:hypothetical protein n=1 Tax=Kribbella sp. NBC_01245 TaxID=2903578 RepID=UPI002E2ADBDF|nr:hypothetical protein [Kribbella sp. NBC_01245]
MTMPLAASTGTASFDQVAIVTGFVSLVYLSLAVLLWRERTGHETVVGRFAGFVGRVDGVPRWAALSPYLHTASLLAAAFGVWWDIAVHIDKGRDTGPFGTPAHYPIFFGILGVIVAGVLPIALAGKPLPARTIKLTKGWRIPCSAALVTFCGTFALVGFPMDDMWHRLFGEDVTLWGPTHLLMIGGVIFSIFARLLALAEVEQLVGTNLRRRAQEIVTVGALLIAWDLFSTEFNYGVPQFPLILQPILIVFGAAMAFTILRSRRGPGTALGALVVYLAVRGLIAFLVDQPLGEILGHFPLLLAEALIVEIVALALGNKNRFRLGVVAGALIGTVGVLAEFGWSQVWMPIPWPSSLLPSAIGFGLATGIGAGLIGAWIATRLAEVAGDVRRTPPLRLTHRLGAAGLALVVAAIFFCVPRTGGEGVSATMTLEPVAVGAEPTAYVTVELNPADAADDARWFDAMAWQGGGRDIYRMVEVAEGTYRSEGPLPLYGKWKSMIRLHTGQREMVAMWVYAPADVAIGKDGIAAVSGSTRTFGHEQQVLRREERTDVPPWMWNTGYALVAVVGVLEIAGIAWLIGRGARGGRLRVEALESARQKENA